MARPRDIAERLSARRPLRVPGRRRLTRAAVAVVLDADEVEASVLLVRRAQRRGDPWSGDMAFPGGRVDADDAHACAAACRETREETGLSLQSSDCIGRLSDRITREHGRPRPMIVTPFVFRHPPEAEWRLNHEIEEVLWVPLAHIADRGNRKRMTWRIGAVPLRVPCVDYGSRRIWGLTLLMLDELNRRLR